MARAPLPTDFWNIPILSEPRTCRHRCSTIWILNVNEESQSKAMPYRWITIIMASAIA